MQQQQEEAPIAGCAHLPQTRLDPEARLTFCIRCADPSTTIAISDLLRAGESELRAVESARKLALCSLGEALTVVDLEDMRRAAKQGVDTACETVLRRLATVQKRLYEDIDRVVEERLGSYTKLQALVREADRILEAADTIHESAVSSMQIVAVNSLLRELHVEPPLPPCRQPQFVSPSPSRRQLLQKARPESVVDSIKKLVDDQVSRTLDLVIYSPSKTFGFNADDLSIQVNAEPRDLVFGDNNSVGSSRVDAQRRINESRASRARGGGSTGSPSSSPSPAVDYAALSRSALLGRR